MQDIYNFLFVKGGVVMWPIVIGSVLALALFLERLWSLRREKVAPEGFRIRIRRLIREEKLSEAEILCQENASALAMVAKAAVKEAGKSRAEIKEVVSEVGRREVSYMERFVDWLGTIAAVEPLMGLLGTVVGLISAFRSVEANVGAGKGVNPGDLAAGIWVAMITTAAGLIVAIPAYIGYRYLQGRVDLLVVEMEEDAMGFADLLASNGSGSSMAMDEKKESKKRDSKAEEQKTEDEEKAE